MFREPELIRWALKRHWTFLGGRDSITRRIWHTTDNMKLERAIWQGMQMATRNLKGLCWHTARIWGSQSSKCKELNSANEKNELESRFSPRAPKRGFRLAGTMISVLWFPELRTQLHHARFLTYIIVSEDVEKREPLFTANGNVFGMQCGKQCAGSSEN